MYKTGVDIVKISRIEKLYNKWESTFLQRYFSLYEINYIRDKKYKPETIAGIFAAKEAVSKSLGQGFGKLRAKDIEINHDRYGKPFVNIKNLKEVNNYKFELSISHEKEYAIAFVLLYMDKTLTNLDFNIKKRKSDSHKGDYGRVGIIAGSKGMLGANYMSSMAALRTGSGLVYSFVPSSLSDIMQAKFTEVIVKDLSDSGGYFNLESFKDLGKTDLKLDALAIGPGMGVNDDLKLFLNKLIKSYKGKMVLDADALNNLDLSTLKSLNRGLIITPHPGEFRKLLSISKDELNKNRLKYASLFAKEYNIVVVLKGENTIVTDGDNVYINKTGNPGMATAGMGDVLTGIIVSFLGQGYGLYEAARLGVYVHGLTGDIIKEEIGEYGMLASDILEKLAKTLKYMTLS